MYLMQVSAPFLLLHSFQIMICFIFSLKHIHLDIFQCVASLVSVLI